MQKKPTGWFLVGVIAVLAACESGYKSAPAPGDSGRDTRDWRWSETGLDIEYREEPATDSAISGEDVASLDEEAVLDAGEACVPVCEGRECGDDGCGGICGYCKYGFLCKAGLCIEYCVPDCTGKACGDDGCGGLCGDCKENEFCAANFTCVLKGCVPSCSGKACGPDGCGGFCGVCGEKQVCDPKSWQCVKDTACHEVTAEGRCLGSLLQWCQNGVLQEKVCDVDAGFVCGFSVLAKKYDCVLPEQCQPQCLGKECGPDQCGGTCGACSADQVCSTVGKCGQPCGEVTEKGTCQGDTLIFCHQGILIIYNCAAYGKRCLWDPTGNSGKGWYDCL